MLGFDADHCVLGFDVDHCVLGFDADHVSWDMRQHVLVISTSRSSIFP